MSRFVYEPVASREGQIRLLILHPAAKHDDEIHGELKAVYLADQPAFEALSYTWGALGEAEPIRLNGKPFRVFENAAAALRRLRLAKTPRSIWIDAICINQDNLQERAEQVLLMQRIYTQAEQVCVWLGELTEGGILGMRELQNRVWSAGWHQFAIDRRFGKPTLPWTEQFTTSRGMMNRNSLLDEQSNGEVRELLDRPWWRRTWIVQEAVLARTILLMCGSETTSWDSIVAFLERSASSTSRIEVFGLPVHEKDFFPDRLYRSITDLREKWQSSPEEVMLLDVLYRFRQLECSHASDKVYGFLGITPEVVRMGLVPDYHSAVADVYWHFARQHIERTGSLDVLNCRRQQRDETAAPRQAYSILDQARYYDVHAVIEYEPGKTRRGWARLPPGWERIVSGKKTRFVDHNSGRVHDKSPLEDQAPRPAEFFTRQRILPPGWTKRWNNVGCQTVEYGEEATQEEIRLKSITAELRNHLSTLPSWVPNWAFPSTWDPEPFIELDNPSPQFRTGGKSTPQLHSASQSSILSLEGFLFDRVATLAPAWHPQTEVPPISRKREPALLAWEVLGLAPVEKCPYALSGGNRSTALWRTMIADKTADEAAPPDDRFYVETWYDRVGWALDTPDLTSLGIWDMTAVDMSMKGVEEKMLWHFVGLDPSRYPEFGEKLRQSYRDGKVIHETYRKYMHRIHRVCAHRALFVTDKGYIGLAPWNAEVGDQVVVLKGGRTPYLLRKSDVDGSVTLVGETYVYGIMDGEVTDGRARVQSPCVVLHIS